LEVPTNGACVELMMLSAISQKIDQDGLILG